MSYEAKALKVMESLKKKGFPVYHIPPVNNSPWWEKLDHTSGQVYWENVETGELTYVSPFTQEPVECFAIELQASSSSALVNTKNLTGSLIQPTDKLLMLAGSDVSIGDELILDDKSYRAVMVNPLRPGGVTLYSEVLLR